MLCLHPEFASLLKQNRLITTFGYIDEIVDRIHHQRRQGLGDYRDKVVLNTWHELPNLTASAPECTDVWRKDVRLELRNDVIVSGLEIMIQNEVDDALYSMNTDIMTKANRIQSILNTIAKHYSQYVKNDLQKNSTAYILNDGLRFVQFGLFRYFQQYLYSTVHEFVLDSELDQHD